MKERPILFNEEMVRAILDGRKTQTRRVMKVQPAIENPKLSKVISTTGDKKELDKLHWVNLTDCGYGVKDSDERYFTCPYGQVGDRLWVRETFGFISFDNGTDTVYKADEDFEPVDLDGSKWHPSIHMPRDESRITLEIANVRVERLQDISEADAIAEGIQPQNGGWKSYEVYHTGKHNGQPTPASMISNKFATFSYEELWESIYGGNSWAQNPFVWVIEFKRLDDESKGGAG